MSAFPRDSYTRTIFCHDTPWPCAVKPGATQMTLIEMQDTAHTCFSRQPFSASLLALVKQHAAYARARSHGNYLPALRAVAREAATIDTSRTRLFLVFLSDGAPSDHTSTRGMTPVDVSNACIQAVEQLGAAAGGRDRTCGSAHGGVRTSGRAVPYI